MLNILTYGGSSYVANWSSWSGWQKSFVKYSPAKTVQGKHITVAGGARELLFSVSSLHNPL